MHNKGLADRFFSMAHAAKEPSQHHHLPGSMLPSWEAKGLTVPAIPPAIRATEKDASDFAIPNLLDSSSLLQIRVHCGKIPGRIL